MMSMLIKRDRLRSWLLLWSPDGLKWYRINSKNITPMPNSDGDPFSTYREAINRVYAGATETFEGKYDKATRKLQVKALTTGTEIVPRMG
jgi:hypothetical protein